MSSEEHYRKWVWFMARLGRDLHDVFGTERVKSAGLSYEGQCKKTDPLQLDAEKTLARVLIVLRLYKCF